MMTLTFTAKTRTPEENATALSGSNFNPIKDILISNIVEQKIKGLPEGPAKKLYLELDEILKRDDAEDYLKERTQKLTKDQKVLYAKYLTIRNSCRSAAMIIGTRNATAIDNVHNIDDMIGEMKDNNVTNEQLARVLGTVTQWKTGTPHPTQHLSEEGKQLFRDILNAENSPTDKRFEAIQKAINEMFDTDITRKKRMTVREETLSDRAQAKLHRQAQRKTYRVTKASLIKHYGEEAPDLLSDKVRMTLPYHTWFGAGDADGKPNADKRALLEGMVGYTLDAIEEHLDDIKNAIVQDSSLQGKLEQSQESLEKVRKRLNAIQDKLYAGDQIDFDELKKEFEGAYKGLSVDHEENGNTKVNSEKELYEKLTKNLTHVIGDANDHAKDILEESLFVMRQYKDTFTTAKIEKRAPGPTDIGIMNQLFADKNLQNSFLTGSMRRALTGRSFSGLSPEEQREIMNHVGKQAKNKRNEIIENYRRIFPEGLDDKGFPNQLHERGERLALQAITPNKFGMSIVAEASEMSAEYAFFLGEQIFGVDNMMHTMLNEDMDTLENSPDYLIDFTKNGGLTSIMNAQTHNPRLKHYLEKHGAMLPCSDSTKQLGPGAFFMQAQAINRIMEFAVLNKQTICIKWGNGQTLTRGGGNAHIPGRLKAQAVQWHLNGRALDLDNLDDIKVLANVMFSSNTEQNRAADFMSPNADRISKNQLSMIGEMLGRSLELAGKVKKGTYIPQIAKFSSGARKVFSEIAKDVMMRGYENFRDAVDKNGNRLSDDIAEKTSNMKVAADANQAARPASKAILTTATDTAETPPKKSGKALYDLRAIGTTISISHMRTYHDGWFTLGEGLKSVHQAYLDRELGDGDLKSFLDDPLWSTMIKNGLRTASMSDMTHAFEKIGMEDWSHDKAMKIGKSVDIDHSKNPPLFTFESDEDGITAEQAYLAKLYYDQALFITYTEKLLEFKKDNLPMPETVEEIEQRAALHLDNIDNKVGRFQVGKLTNEFFPRVDQDKNDNRRETLAAQILSDTAEETHDDFTEEERYALTAAQRSSQAWNNSDLFMDQDAYGSKPALTTAPQPTSDRKKAPTVTAP